MHTKRLQRWVKYRRVESRQDWWTKDRKQNFSATNYQSFIGAASACISHCFTRFILRSLLFLILHIDVRCYGQIFFLTSVFPFCLKGDRSGNSLRCILRPSMHAPPVTDYACTGGEGTGLPCFTCSPKASQWTYVRFQRELRASRFNLTAVFRALPFGLQLYTYGRNSVR